MDSTYEHQLVFRFPYLTLHEISQEIAIAEHEAADRGKPLAFTIALRNLLDLERKRSRFATRFPVSISDMSEDAYLRALANDGGFDAFVSEMDWAAIVRLQPLPVRKLVEFAKSEAERFEDVPYGVWYLHNLMELRRRVKRRYLDWDRDHSEKSYERARAAVVALLRKHGGKRKE